ncbi:transcriptional regulator [Enterovibrio norvegicus FF-33]|uniref:Transcriptional regulator n=1 Tax=Enterovibrio norvegicus FF-454 TaxID=1185651 RepID=A0A1E5C183_9GAMM|nr:ChrR family anti-sigma-E factor [Enterovibrio norvegicus]OEE59260.1 transcriptional regulator [Enterovibrio norvegicus FF-454]OEE67627.1 transcriptional regulator [Enterovibrio norvegicus FF-33]
MIKYHPADDLLYAHAAGTLPASMSIAVSAHSEMCDFCAKKVALFENQIADETFNLADNSEASSNASDSDEFAGMLSAILSDEQLPSTPISPSPESKIDVAGERYTLPTALRRYHHLGWSSVGSLSRARLPLNEGDTRASLLHIGMNSGVPSHTHKGTEVTLLLSGHFEDEHDSYVPGDFIILDSSNHHTPQTHDGCLCYTIADAPLHFTKGVSQLLNAVGHVIY